MTVILPKTKEEIAHYLPHSGAMCLIDEVINISELNISARTNSHKAKYNPLKFENKLPAVSGIEYAAQTAALHLGLSTTDNLYPKTECFLAAVQNCVIHLRDLDSITYSLNIDCTQLYLDTQCGALYEFRIFAEHKTVLTGQLLIMLKQKVSL